MKTTYGHIILRYVHDVVTGEFANIGVVLYAPEQRLLESRFTSSYERLNAIFLKIDHLHYRALIRHLGNRFEELAAEIRNGLDVPPVTALEGMVRRVLPADDSSLQWSAPGGGSTPDPRAVLGELYRRFVERYVAGAEQVTRADEDIAKPFKAKLGRAAEKLCPKRIEAKDYQYEFSFGYQNAIWHLYEPVSFDLLEPNSIREKAVRWYGRSAALQETSEKFKIHFLLGEPRQPGTQEAFQNALHLLANMPGQNELIREKDIERAAEQLADEVGKHAAEEMMLRDKPTQGA